MVRPIDRCKCIELYVDWYRYLVIYREVIDMWFGSSVVECRYGIPETPGFEPCASCIPYTTLCI